ncbi:MAG: MFS transporter [Phenylobacterium sp.]|nr:MFS transporter [Phenylobacterium sp.]
MGDARLTTATATHADRLSFPRLLAFSSGAIPGYLLIGIMGVYLPRFYAGHLGIGLLELGAAIAGIRLVDIGIDLAIGMAMDKTKTPFGRYRPWYLLGLPVLAFTVFKVFNPPDDAGISYLVVWYMLLYVAYSLLVLGHAAWAGTLTANYNERSRIFGWMMGIALAGNVAINALPFLTGGAINPARSEGMPTIGWIIIAISAVTIPLAVMLAPERAPPVAHKEKLSFKDYAAVVTKPSMFRLILADLFLTLGPGTTAPMYVFFFHDAKKFTLTEVPELLIFYLLAGVVGAPAWGHVARKLGKHRTIQVACVVYAITQSLLMAMPAGNFWLTALGMFAVGFAASAFVLLIRAMVADVADELRLETGRERSGVLFALVTMTQKFGTSITVSIVYPILAYVGYNAKDGAVNTEHAIWGLEMCYLFAPVILVVVGGLCLIGYSLTAERHAEIRSQLEALVEKDVAAAEESLTGPVEGVAPAR